MQTSHTNGQKRKNKLTAVLRLERYTDAWALAAILSLAAFAVIRSCMISSYVFDVADDRFLAAYLAGYWTGESEAQLPFIHPIYTAFISTLYKAFPNGYWYADVFLLWIVLSSICIMRCIFEASKSAGIPIWAAGIVNIGVYALLSYDQIWVSFTTASGVLCAAAAVLLVFPEKTKKTRIFSDIVGALMITIAFLIRQETGIVGVCFSLAALFYRVMHALFVGKPEMRRAGVIGVVITALSIALLAGGVMGTMELYENLPENQEYYEFRRACAAFFDYPHHVEDPEAHYASLGVSQDLVNLIKQWFFMDPRIDADLLNELCGNDNPESAGSLLAVHNGLWKALKTCGHLFVRPTIHHDVYLAQLVVLPCILVFMMAVVLCQRVRKQCWLEALTIACCCAGAFVLCIYTCFLGRFPLRVLRIIAVPCCCICLVLFLLMLGNIPCEKRLGKKGRNNAVICTVVLGLSATLTPIHMMVDPYDSVLKRHCVVNSKAIDEYVIEHPSNIYFYGNDLCLFNEAYPEYDDVIPVNLLYWGGCYLGREPYNDQMAANGFDTLDAELFLQDNVYYLKSNFHSSLEIDALTAYLKDRFGITEARVVDSISNGEIEVYAFY